MSDLIRREDIIAVLCFSQETGQMVCGDLRKLLEEIKAIPSAEPEERKQKIHDDKIHPTIHHCGHDTLTLVKPAWNYCPNCGMKLEWI